MNTIENEQTDNFLICCPNCNEIIIIEKINCGIFRHGQYITSGNQLEPHAPKTQCDYLFQNKMIYGCGKPFQILLKNDAIKIIKCDYI